jgi:hypothetical protein
VTSIKYENLAKELKKAGETLVKASDMVAKLHSALRLQISEMFFSKRLVLVEEIKNAISIGCDK